MSFLLFYLFLPALLSFTCLLCLAQASLIAEFKKEIEGFPGACSPETPPFSVFLFRRG